jgi:hypothetical protein
VPRSWDSSWTLNAVMVKKSTMLSKQVSTLLAVPLAPPVH